MLGPYTPTAKTARVTKAEGRKVFEIDGAPALEWVVGWLGEAVSKEAKEGGLVLPQTADKPICAKRGGQFIPAHLASLHPDDKSIEFFIPMSVGEELVVMDAGTGPSTGYASTLAAAYDVALAAGGLTAPKAGVLLFCGGMSIAVGDNLKAGLSDKTFCSKVAGLPLLGMTVFGEQAVMPLPVGNVHCNLSIGMLLFE
uniref:FIST C-domain domain-containing protein n=2 Tax=Coccolithus braarudii TaxID=221442 RepID=A0A7S0Q2C9_9EUKA|mmetsp:Transcript_26046/g.56254  ORF Transcript_26046/g.56254 Transcript_26046/m.56254 type:complete len:198 (+) Transcript_26046:3-596(+)